MIQKYIYLFAFSSFKKKSQKMTSRQRSRYTANWLRPNTCVKKKVIVVGKDSKDNCNFIGSLSCENVYVWERSLQSSSKTSARKTAVSMCNSQSISMCEVPVRVHECCCGVQWWTNFRLWWLWVCFPIPWLCPFPNCDLFPNSTKEFCCIKLTQQPMIRKEVNNKKETLI